MRIRLFRATSIGRPFGIEVRWRKAEHAGGGTRTPDTRIMIPLSYSGGELDRSDGGAAFAGATLALSLGA